MPDSASVSTNCWVSPLRTSMNGGKSEMGLGNAACRASSATALVGVNATRCSASPTKRITVVEKPPSSRFALVAIASNTGCTSEGELAMTFNTSAVAVCRSSASCVSLNSRAFSIAISA